MLEATTYAVIQHNAQDARVPVIELHRNDFGVVTSKVIAGSEQTDVLFYEVRFAEESGMPAVAMQHHGSLEEAAAISEEILRCNVPSVFIAQAWVSNHAIEIDDGRLGFNAASHLARLSFEQMQALFDGDLPPNLDFLAEQHGLTKVHDGPFKVICDKTDLVHLVFLLNGFDDKAEDNHQISDITEEMWGEFCLLASAICGLEKQPAEAEFRLVIGGHTFVLDGIPGEVVSIESWVASPAPGDALEQALRDQFESVVLALHSSGALISNGKPVPAVLQALESAIDQIPEIHERHDQAEESAAAERARGDVVSA